MWNPTEETNFEDLSSRIERTILTPYQTEDTDENDQEERNQIRKLIQLSEEKYEINPTENNYHNNTDDEDDGGNNEEEEDSNPEDTNKSNETEEDKQTLAELNGDISDQVIASSEDSEPPDQNYEDSDDMYDIPEPPDVTHDEIITKKPPTEGEGDSEENSDPNEDRRYL